VGLTRLFNPTTTIHLPLDPLVVTITVNETSRPPRWLLIPALQRCSWYPTDTIRRGAFRFQLAYPLPALPLFGSTQHFDAARTLVNAHPLRYHCLLRSMPSLLDCIATVFAPAAMLNDNIRWRSRRRSWIVGCLGEYFVSWRMDRFSAYLRQLDILPCCSRHRTAASRARHPQEILSTTSAAPLLFISQQPCVSPVRRTR